MSRVPAGGAPYGFQACPPQEGCGFSRISSSSLKQLWAGHVFFRFGTGGLQELVKAEEFAAEGTAVGGPLGFRGQSLTATDFTLLVSRSKTTSMRHSQKRHRAIVTTL